MPSFSSLTDKFQRRPRAAPRLNQLFTMIIIFLCLTRPWGGEHSQPALRFLVILPYLIYRKSSPSYIAKYLYTYVILIHHHALWFTSRTSKTSHKNWQVDIWRRAIFLSLLWRTGDESTLAFCTGGDYGMQLPYVPALGGDINLNRMTQCCNIHHSLFPCLGLGKTLVGREKQTRTYEMGFYPPTHLIA